MTYLARNSTYAVLFQTCSKRELRRPPHQPSAWWQSIFCRCSQSLEQSTHRPQDCYLFNGRFQTSLEDLELFYQCFCYYHYHHRYHYPYHHFIINILCYFLFYQVNKFIHSLCAVGHYMYCRRHNTNDCLHYMTCSGSTESAALRRSEQPGQTARAVSAVDAAYQRGVPSSGRLGTRVRHWAEPYVRPQRIQRRQDAGEQRPPSAAKLVQNHQTRGLGFKVGLGKFWMEMGA